MLPLAPIVSSAAAAVAKAAAAIATQPPPTAAPEGLSFAQTLDTFATQTVDSLRSGEAAAIGGVEGKIPVQKVVDTVLNAERDLQTAIALRDRAVSAYQEISRMAI